MFENKINLLEYSVVIPQKNELGNLSQLLDEVHDSMASLSASWELIIIDDGSSDRSYEYLRKAQKSHKQLRVLKMDQNYGQSAALAAGFKAARGEFVITLDADLQNDPKDIARLASLKNSADIVVGWRRDRQDTWSKKIISKVANFVRSRLCDDGVHDTGCSLKLMRRKALLELFWFKGAHRFLPALFKLEGYQVAEIEVNHRERHAGKSHYHLFNRSLAPIVDMFAFVWLKRRKLKYRVECEHNNG